MGVRKVPTKREREREKERQKYTDTPHCTDSAQRVRMRLCCEGR